MAFVFGGVVRELVEVPRPGWGGRPGVGTGAVLVWLQSVEVSDGVEAALRSGGDRVGSVGDGGA